MIEKGEKEIRIPLNEKMFRALFDLQYMIDDVWGTLRLNKIDKPIQEFFNVVSQVIDCKDNGKCYKLMGIKIVECKEKFYHSKKPIWRKKK